MNVGRSAPVNPPYPIAPLEKSQWIRINNDLPQQGDLVPVWDGDCLYYATYWNRDGYESWIVSQAIETTNSSFKFKKSPGEQIYPIQWMRINPPNE